MYIAPSLSYLYGHRGYLIRELAKRVDLIVVTHIDIEPPADLLEVKVINCKLNYAKPNLLNLCGKIIKISKFIRYHDPDIIHVFSIKICLIVVFANLFKGVKTILGINGLGSVFYSTKSRYRVMKLLTVCVLKFAGRFKNNTWLVQNIDDMRSISRFSGVSVDRIRLIQGAGVDVKHYYYTTNRSLDCKTIVTLSRLITDKGIRELVAAAAILEKILPDWNFLIAGTIDPNNPDSLCERDILNYTSSLKNLSFVGFVDDISAILDKGSIFILPSYGEGFPKAVLEAQCKGLAAIVCDAPGMRDLVTDRVTGLLVPVRSVISIVRGILFYVRNEAVYESIRRKARQMVEEKWSCELVLKKHLALYNLDSKVK